MGTDRDRSGFDGQIVFEDLASALQRLRGGVHAGDMAQSLLRYATGPTALVAVVDDGRRAIFYNSKVRVVTAIPFDKHGPSVEDREVVWREVGDPSTWVDAHADEVEWVHPRYRWVLDLEGGSWEVAPERG